MNDKPRYVIVLDPAEIASIKRNEYGDIIGGHDPYGQFWAYTESLDAWRERQRAASTDHGEHHDKR